jgi:hypothetical protein
MDVSRRPVFLQGSVLDHACAHVKPPCAGAALKIAAPIRNGPGRERDGSTRI